MIESEIEFARLNAASIYTDRSPEAAAVRSMPYEAYASGERAEEIRTYKATRRLQSHATAFPRIAWLVALPASERAFHGEPERRSLLREFYPEVPEDVWLNIFAQ